MQKVEATIEKNGVLKLGGDRVEQIRFNVEGKDFFSPGNPSDRREIKIGTTGKILAGEKSATILYFRSYGMQWDEEGKCYCVDPPVPPVGPWPWPWPPKMLELGKVSLRVDGKSMQKLKVFLGINGVLKLGDKRVGELLLEDGRVLPLGESSDLRTIAIGKKGEIQFDGKLVTSLHFVSESAEWDLGAKSYRLGPAPPKAPAPPRE